MEQHSFICGGGGGDGTVQTATSDVSEVFLVRDVVYAMQGIDGRYIRFDKVQDGYSIVREVCFLFPRRCIISL